MAFGQVRNRVGIARLTSARTVLKVRLFVRLLAVSGA